MIEILKKITDKQSPDNNSSSFTSHSDANLLYESGCHPIILGPGELAKAHTREESVLFSQVVSASQCYFDLLINL
jgi:acetylornithine deacetylase